MQANDADRAAALAIDALEWLNCDGRHNPQLLDIIAAHRIQSARNARAEALGEAKAAVRASVKQETGEYLWAIEVALEAIEALKGAK